jgi:GTP1/Obg family GTP-binding protein
VSDIDLLKSDYGQLKELILQGFISQKLDYSQTMNKKVLQLYEISQVNVGVLLVGMPQTGKTSMIELLETALNKASNNELKIRCA